MDDDRRPAPTATNESMIGLQHWFPTVVGREHGYRRVAAAHKTQYLGKTTICSWEKRVVHGRLISASIRTLIVSCS